MAKIKINIKSLAAESRFNRIEASKFKGLEKSDLNEHRRYQIKNESRVAQWIYAYARGIPRSKIESSVVGESNKYMFKKRAIEKLKRLRIDHEGFEKWLAD